MAQTIGQGGKQYESWIFLLHHVGMTFIIFSVPNQCEHQLKSHIDVINSFFKGFCP
jgi:hypothetical protein